MSKPPKDGVQHAKALAAVTDWLSESPFGPTFAYAATLTHEICRGLQRSGRRVGRRHDVTRGWIDPTGSICSDVLQTGDVIVYMPNQIYPITLNGFTYHTQTESLTQWFESVTPSDAIGGAFSYANTTVLTNPLVSQKPNCAP